MIKNRMIRVLVLGLMIWLVPFMISFAFYDRSGALTISYDLFKSLMMVISALASSYAIVRHYRQVEDGFWREGWITGSVWLLVSLALDVLVLLPLSGMSFGDYFAAIGLRYLQIPIVCVAVGRLLESKQDHQQKFQL